MSSLQSPSDASARNDLVYGLDDRPSAPIALLAALTRSTAPDDDWIDRNTTLILKGIGA